MKYFPIAAISVLFAACTTVPPTTMQSIGKSAKAPSDVAQCIAKQWADASQQPVTVQTQIANDQGLDVLMPGQPPGGNAAIVRPLGTGSWVGVRTVGGSPAPANTASINDCL